MKVLVIVDMQNDFVYGSLGTPEAQAIVENVKWKLECARQNGDLVIFTKDTHYPDYLTTKEGSKLPIEHCIKGTPGWEIISELTPKDNENRIIKYTFGSNDLADIIAEYVDEYYETHDENQEFIIDICGVCTDICVISNALILKARFPESCEIYVDHQCCAGVTPETHEAALTTMKMCQINVL